MHYTLVAHCYRTAVETAGVHTPHTLWQYRNHRAVPPPEVLPPDARETYLQDADALQLDFLTHLEEVLHGLAQLLQHGLDITLLNRCLTLDKVGN